MSGLAGGPARRVGAGLPRALLLAPALVWAAAPVAAASWSWVVPVGLATLAVVAVAPVAPVRTAGTVLVLLLAALDAVRTQAAGALWVTVLALLLAGWLVLGERWPNGGRTPVLELLGVVLACGACSALVAALAVAGPRGGLALLVLGLAAGAMAYRLAAGRSGD